MPMAWATIIVVFCSFAITRKIHKLQTQISVTVIYLFIIVNHCQLVIAVCRLTRFCQKAQWFVNNFIFICRPTCMYVYV